MKTMVNNVLLWLWQRCRGVLQWRILWLFHDKFVVGVTGVIFNTEGKVLLLKHRFRRKSAVWGLPGGHMRHGETFEEALLRELHEETGYRARIDKQLSLDSGRALRIEATYQGVFEGGTETVDGTEIVEVQFCDPEQLPEDMLDSQKERVKRAHDAR